ncbi:hypothetical protein B4U80_02968 [Leptotrombidium deliense]|uniref:Uncharacterized protein n=1 Tax=Leptotrombidium deliense TaxID=299467 RepID=A0A443SDS2_9ACAR|nr:hypothetical protein B4U80_02968 [Leptotrombidium deliense]
MKMKASLRQLFAKYYFLRNLFS